MSIYLAGPMSGRPKFNYPAFDTAASKLRASGVDIVSPAEMDDEETRAVAMASTTGRLSEFANKTGESWGDFLSRDVKLIADSDIEGICLLPEWDQSKGARLEAFVCMSLDYPVYLYQPDGTMAQLDYEHVFEHIMEGIIV